MHTLGPAVAGGYTIGPCKFVNVIFLHNPQFFLGRGGVEEGVADPDQEAGLDGYACQR